MNKKYPIGVMSKVAAVALMIGAIGTVTNVHAASGDYYDVKSKKIFKPADLGQTENIRALINSLRENSKVIFEYREGNFFDYAKTSDSVAKGKKVIDAIKVTENKINPANYGNFKDFIFAKANVNVSSVSAINETTSVTVTNNSVISLKFRYKVCSLSINSTRFVA